MSSEEVAQEVKRYYALIREAPPSRLTEREADLGLLAACQPFRCGPDGGIAGWRIGEGPVVAMVHGWGGQGVQFVRMAHHLAKRGFAATFIDVRNHGASAPGHLGFDRFMKDAAELQACLGAPPFAWVGHSAGALGVMAARRILNLDASAFVCLATPFHPYVPLDKVRAVGAGPGVIEGLKALLAQEFSESWNDLEHGAVWSPQGRARLMAVYDETDATISTHDAWKVARKWQGARVMLTSGFGHNRILGAEMIIESVSDFLAGCRADHAAMEGIAA